MERARQTYRRIAWRAMLVNPAHPEVILF